MPVSVGVQLPGLDRVEDETNRGRSLHAGKSVSIADCSHCMQVMATNDRVLKEGEQAGNAAMRR